MLAFLGAFAGAFVGTVLGFGLVGGVVLWLDSRSENPYGQWDFGSVGYSSPEWEGDYRRS